MIAAALLVLQIVAPPAWDEIRLGQVTLQARPNDLSLGMAVVDGADAPREWYGLGRRSPGPFRVVLVPDAGAMAALTRGRGPRWAAGLTFASTGTIILRRDVDDLRLTLRHELAHLVLHRAIRGRVPLWFSEGYAVLASGEFGTGDAFRLSAAVLWGRIPALGGLNGGLRDARRPDEAYALAGSAVAALARANPEQNLHALFGRLAEGTPFSEAVQLTTGLSVSQFEDQWRREVRRRYGLGTWLIAGGGWTVLGIAVLALRRFRRAGDRVRREALDVGWVLPEDGDDAPMLDPHDGTR